MKRWFICRLGEFETPGFITPKVDLYGVNSRIWSRNGFDWCFGQLAASDLTGLQADQDIYLLPDASLDIALSSIPSNIRTTMRTRLEAAGFTFADVRNTWTIREVLVYLLKQIQPVLDSVEQGDVQDKF